MPRLLVALAFLLPACASPSVAPDGGGPPMSDVRVTLTEGGLMAQATPSGPLRLVEFGAPLRDAVAAVTGVHEAPSNRGTNEECGAGPVGMVNWPDFALLSQNEQFDGWAVSSRTDAGDDFRLESGLGIGSTRAEVDAAGGKTVAGSTLGEEFAVGEVYGLLSGPGADATVTHLWAGLSCTFR